MNIMSKALCIISMAVFAILLLIFLLDMLAGIPFGRANMMTDIWFVIASGALGTFDFLVFRKLK